MPAVDVEQHVEIPSTLAQSLAGLAPKQSSRTLPCESLWWFYLSFMRLPLERGVAAAAVEMQGDDAAHVATEGQGEMSICRSAMTGYSALAVTRSALPVQARARASRSASWQARPDAVALGIRGSGGRPTVQLAARENSRQPRSARSRPFP
jgi:hypothetical protein